MKSHHNARVSLGGLGGSVLLVVLLLAAGAGCSTTQKAHNAAPDHVIGKPPPADEDPFFINSMPGEAVPVAASGEINDSDGKHPASAKHAATDKPASSDSTKPPHADEPVQCFSCVRICPAEGDCAKAKKDVICGWGTHKKSSEAKRMAKAQCDATLDMARQMPVWSKISGECPVATCRQ